MLNKIVSIAKKGDYLYARVPDHPNCTDSGYVLLHRVIKENELNRYLNDNEIVHHLDENKFNNDPSNLEVMSRVDHTKLHNTTGRSIVNLTCPNCGIIFTKEKRQIKKGSTPKCSRKCNGQYSRKIQINSARSSDGRA